MKLSLASAIPLLQAIINVAFSSIILKMKFIAKAYAKSLELDAICFVFMSAPVRAQRYISKCELVECKRYFSITCMPYELVHHFYTKSIVLVDCRHDFCTLIPHFGRDAMFHQSYILRCMERQVDLKKKN